MQEKETVAPAKKRALKNEDVIDASVLSTDEFIKKSIQKYNLPDKVISELKKDYAGLVVIDAETYETTKKARQIVRAHRTGVEAKRKELKGVAITYGNAIDGEAKRLTALLLEVETPVDEQIKKWEGKKEEERLQKEKDLQAKINLRITELSRFGIGFNGENYSNGGAVLVSPIQLKEMPDDQFKFLLDMAEESHKLEAEKRQADIAAAAAEFNRIEAEKQELKRQQDELAAQKKKMEDDLKRMEAEKTEIENKRLLAEQKEREQLEAENLAKKQALFNKRTNELSDLGFVVSAKQAIAVKQFSFSGVLTIPLNDIADLSDSQFDIIIEGAKKDIADKEAENERLEAAHMEEINKKAKEKADLEARQLQELEEQKAAMAPDKEKLNHLAEDIRKLIEQRESISLKSAAAKKICADTIALLEKTYTFVLDKINGLK